MTASMASSSCVSPSIPVAARIGAGKVVLLLASTLVTTLQSMIDIARVSALAERLLSALDSIDYLCSLSTRSARWSDWTSPSDQRCVCMVRRVPNFSDKMPLKRGPLDVSSWLRAQTVLDISVFISKATQSLAVGAFISRADPRAAHGIDTRGRCLAAGSRLWQSTQLLLSWPGSRGASAKVESNAS